MSTVNCPAALNRVTDREVQVSAKWWQWGTLQLCSYHSSFLGEVVGSCIRAVRQEQKLLLTNKGVRSLFKSWQGHCQPDTSYWFCKSTFLWNRRWMEVIPCYLNSAAEQRAAGRGWLSLCSHPAAPSVVAQASSDVSKPQSVLQLQGKQVQLHLWWKVFEIQKDYFKKMVPLRFSWFIPQMSCSSVSGLVLVTIQTHSPAFVRAFFFVLAGNKIQANGLHLPMFCAASFRVGRKNPFYLKWSLMPLAFCK